MARFVVDVNGISYTRMEYESSTGALTLIREVHADGTGLAVFKTTMEELQTQYGRRTAFLVGKALLAQGYRL